ncbi:MAG: hypothetical protein IJ242_16925 [Clostridia bacterium]|nr:hypothetical protein [Clostridia bacterium]
MTGRLEQIEHFLLKNLGHAFFQVNPDLAYSANRILLGVGAEDTSLTTIWHRLDSFLFNTIYNTTSHTMLLIMDDHQTMRATEAFITDLADRLLALFYSDQPQSSELEAQLYDLSRNGSFSAMRELLARYNPAGIEREMIVRVLEENGQLQ